MNRLTEKGTRYQQQPMKDYRGKHVEYMSINSGKYY